MPLAQTVDSLDTIPETARGAYVKDEVSGKFILDFEVEDTTGLKSALTKTRAERDAIAKAEKEWKALGKSPTEISELLAANEKAAEEAQKKAGNFDQVLAKHKSDWAKQLADSEAKLSGERDTALSVARKAVVDTRITGALTKGKVTPEGMVLLVDVLGKRVQLDLSEGKENVSILGADGTAMVGTGKDGLATFDDLVKEATKQFPSLFEGTNAGGGGKQPGSGNGGKPGEKTMSRADWDALNPYEQAAKIKAGIRPVD